ncbi:D-amino acid dehydrogenase small subunit [Pseudovibrio sp. Ad13]|uniref:NAD(P)/FAD-dependent oxidoreductase n=1 Tax=Pseudovibrio sp. Ad13 TaxID=989396 RepID=UPI0007AE6DE6|nr:FAD-dependent oxidoreductase [Pseudovibrio sp. Ad13]KZK84520.1 D-amino acid dehydrogenase small subunit [Pseudovibrio sp. Ad13]
MTQHSAEVAIIGAGIAGIATAYYLAEHHNITNMLLIEQGQPMAFTSAQSGENYRNWWPHPSMVDFTNHSIDLMEKIARDSNNRLHMNRRGYALATRRTQVDDLVEQVRYGYDNKHDDLIRFHGSSDSVSYKFAEKPDWESAPDGVDVMQNQDLIRRAFPSFSEEIQTVLHIRRGGDISGQQMGMYMLEKYRAQGGRRLTGMVKQINQQDGFELEIETGEGLTRVKAEKIVNAAGPFAGKIAEMIGETLPVYNTFQQKIAFEDVEKAIPRNLPFSIDLDEQFIDWSEDEKDWLAGDDEYKWLTEQMPGAIHCRPDGGDNGSWLKLGWAYNETPQNVAWEPVLNDQFPEIVLRGAARLNPSLKAYYDKLPRNMTHYGGWYTMTEENWPLIGPMGESGAEKGAFMVAALSGFGTMAACASADLVAKWVAEDGKPKYASDFSLERYQNAPLLAELKEASKGVL